MKTFLKKNLMKILIVFIASSFISAGLFSSNASADCYQYTSSGTMITSATPVFNNFCNVPYGVNNEANFVRIRQDSSGNVMDNTNNPPYSSGVLTSTCNSGTKYDIWNYLHNNASTNYNPDVNPSNPSAVAHNVQEILTANFGQNSYFVFADTVVASNAATVKDHAILSCGNTRVQMSIVPGSVHIYSAPYGWLNLADSTINGGPLTVGSPVAGSGNMWGCWNYRMVIVYQVQVTAIPTPTPPTNSPTCNLITLEATNSVAKLEGVTYSAGSSTVSGVTINFGNGTSSIVNLTPAQIAALSKTPYTYVYSSPGNYSVTATVDTSLGNVTSPACTTVVNVVTPPTQPNVPVPPTTPTALVNTGPGNVIGIFVGFVIAGIIGFKVFAKRKLFRLF